MVTVVNLESSAAQQAAGQAQANGTSASAQSGLQVAVRPNAASSQVRLLGGNTVELILPEQQPPTVAQMPKAPEANLVAQATSRGLFSEQLQQAQDGSSLMVLAPLPAQ